MYSIKAYNIQVNHYELNQGYNIQVNHYVLNQGLQYTSKSLCTQSRTTIYK